MVWTHLLKNWTPKNGRFIWRVVLVVMAFSVSLFAIRRLYHSSAMNVSLLSVYQPLGNYGVHPEYLEIWNHPSVIQNETWTELKTTIGNLHIMVYPPEWDRIVSLSLLVNGSWEESELLGVERLFRCDPDLGLVDIGANIGLYVLLGAKYERHVVAVEPSVDNIARLYASVKKNNFEKYVTLVHNAISNAYTTMELTANPWNRGNTVIRDVNDPSFHVPGEFEVPDRLHVGTVKTIIMDDLVPIVKFPRGILKIDIEGAEKLAFEFSRNFMTELEIPYIFMEWLWIKQDQKQADHLYKYFTSNGYRPFKNARLDIALGENYLNWPTDVFWVNVEKTGPCKPELRRGIDEGLRDDSEQPDLPPDMISNLEKAGYRQHKLHVEAEPEGVKSVEPKENRIEKQAILPLD